VPRRSGREGSHTETALHLCEAPIHRELRAGNITAVIAGRKYHCLGKDASKSVVMRWEPIDTRARLELEHRRGQVKDGVVNAVVMDVSAVGRLVEWPVIIARLPGNEFAKVGAVVFFDQGSYGPPRRVDLP
jgi:hypothetical protein